MYDQDAIVATKGPLYCGENNDLTNNDETRVGTKEFADHLLFNAQFECGNLRKVSWDEEKIQFLLVLVIKGFSHKRLFCALFMSLDRQYLRFRRI